MDSIATISTFSQILVNEFKSFPSKPIVSRLIDLSTALSEVDVVADSELNINKIIEYIDGQIDQMLPLLHYFNLKTVLGKLIKKKKPQKSAPPKNELLKESIGDLVKLMSIIQMIGIRELQTIELAEAFDKCDSTILWVGLATQQQSTECSGRIQVVVKLNIDEASHYLEANPELIGAPTSHFRIIIDRDIDYDSCTNFLEWIKEKNLTSFPICIICKDIFSHIPVLARNSLVMLATVPTQYQFFISSMLYRPKVRNIVTFKQSPHLSGASSNSFVGNSTLDLEDEEDTDEEASQRKDFYREDTVLLSSHGSTGVNNSNSNGLLTNGDSNGHIDVGPNTPNKSSSNGNGSGNVDSDSHRTTSNRSQILKNMSSPGSGNNSSRNISPTHANKHSPGKGAANTSGALDTPSKFTTSKQTTNNNTSTSSNNTSTTTTTNTPQRNSGKIGIGMSLMSSSAAGGSAGDGTFIHDPALNRISPQNTCLSLTTALHITTGRVMSAHVHLRDALDNPVQTSVTSTHSGFGPVSSHPIQIYLEGPSPVPGPHPAYIYVVGPGILGVSFFPTHNGTYYLHAEIESTAIKNSPCVFHSSSISSNSNTLINSTQEAKQKKRKQRASVSLPAPITESNDDLLDIFTQEKKQKADDNNNKILNNNNSNKEDNNSNNSSNNSSNNDNTVEQVPLHLPEQAQVQEQMADGVNIEKNGITMDSVDKNMLDEFTPATLLYEHVSPTQHNDDYVEPTQHVEEHHVDHSEHAIHLHEHHEHIHGEHLHHDHQIQHHEHTHGHEHMHTHGHEHGHTHHEHHEHMEHQHHTHHHHEHHEQHDQHQHEQHQHEQHQHHYHNGDHHQIEGESERQDLLPTLPIDDDSITHHDHIEQHHSHHQHHEHIEHHEHHIQHHEHHEMITEDINIEPTQPYDSMEETGLDQDNQAQDQQLLNNNNNNNNNGNDNNESLEPTQVTEEDNSTQHLQTLPLL